MSDKQLQDNFDFLFSFSFMRDAFRSFGFFGEFVTGANDFAQTIVPDDGIESLTFDEAAEKFVAFFTSFRRQIRTQVSKTRYEFPVSDWDVPEILKYCRRIDNIAHRSAYLSYVVREYQNYENIVKDKFENLMNRIMKNDPNIIIAVLRGMYNSIKERPNLRNMMIPLHGKSNFQLLIEELNFTNMLQNRTDTHFMSDFKKSLMEANRETPEPEQKTKEAGPTEFLTVAEAAQLLKVTPQTIYARRKRGELRATKVGRKVLIDKREIDKLL